MLDIEDFYATINVLHLCAERAPATVDTYAPKGALSMYQNYIFDLYGTLIDIRTDEYSVAFWRKAVSVFAQGKASYSPGELKNAYSRYVRAALWRERFRHPFYHHRDIELIEVFDRLYRDKGITPDHDLLYGTARRFRKASTIKLCLYDGVLDLLDSLKAAGKSIYLLSNAQESFTVPELEETGIIDYFDGIMISSQERICKPEKLFFDKLINKYGLDRSQCIMIGNDKNSDMLGAAKAGIDGLYIHQEISPSVESEDEITARWKIMDGDVYKIKTFVLAPPEVSR